MIPKAVCPTIEVVAAEVDPSTSTCSYVLSVVPRLGAACVSSRVRWSEMEAIAKELRALYPAMPETLVLPNYWLSTTDPAKLEQRRRELAAFWHGLVEWLAGEWKHDWQVKRFLASVPMQRLLPTASAGGGGGDDNESLLANDGWPQASYEAYKASYKAYNDNYEANRWEEVRPVRVA